MEIIFFASLFLTVLGLFVGIPLTSGEIDTAADNFVNGTNKEHVPTSTETWYFLVMMSILILDVVSRFFYFRSWLY